MKQANYMCDCCSWIHVFPESDKRERYFCPDCGHEMWYLDSEDIDEESGLVVKHYINETRKANSSGIGQPIVECPYCHSTNTRKLPEKSVFMADNLFWGSKVSEVGKNFHCNKCGADF